MENLADRIARDGPVNELDAVGWVIRLAKRLEALHVLGVAHGSVSPACVFTAAADRTAKAYLADVQRTASSPAYQSPERTMGGDLSPADDAWGLAATLYAVLTGAGPFAGSSEAETRQKILAAAPAPLAVFDVGDDDLQHILDRAFARDQGQRTATVQALRKALEEWHPDPGVGALPALEDEDATEDDDTDGATIMRPAPAFVSRSIPRVHEDDEDDDDVRTVAREFVAPGAPVKPAAFSAPRPAAGRVPDAAPAPRPMPPAFANIPLPKQPDLDVDDEDSSEDQATVAREIPAALFMPGAQPMGPVQPGFGPPAPAPAKADAKPGFPGPAWGNEPLAAATMALPGFDFPEMPAGPAPGAPAAGAMGPAPGAQPNAFAPGALQGPLPGPAGVPAGIRPAMPTLNEDPSGRSGKRGMIIAAIVTLLIAAAITFVLLRFRGHAG